jgi:hypothetical protein
MAKEYHAVLVLLCDRRYLRIDQVVDGEGVAVQIRNI